MEAYFIVCEQDNDFRRKLESQITVASIRTRKIRYYEDFSDEQKRRAFCRERDITLLPSKKGTVAYRLIGKSFLRERLQRIAKTTPLFSSRLLDKFEKSPQTPLFTIEDNHITGVLHFSDYNRLPVYTYFYYLVSSCERMMRAICAQEESGKERPELQEEQFSHIIKRFRELHPGVISSKEAGYLVDLRNMVMHSKNGILHIDYKKGPLQFLYSSFLRLLRRRKLLLDCLEHLRRLF